MTDGTNDREEDGMRVAIAGAGQVGRSLARALIGDGHKVLLIERQRRRFDPGSVPGADWMMADACEVTNLHAAGISTCDVVMAATNDDKVNLVFALLAKTEFGVPRVVARVNDPGSLWLFDESWGVDVAVSTPSALVAAVEEAITVGDIVRLMTLEHSRGNIVAITLPPDSLIIGVPLHELPLPKDAALLSVIRNGAVLTPAPEIRPEPGDELVLVATPEVERELRSIIGGDVSKGTLAAF